MSSDMIESVFITSAPDENGVYHVILETDKDTAIPMDATAAYRWAREVLAAVAAAEYDAAVIRHLRTMEMSDQLISQMIVDIRKDRPDRITSSMIPDLSLKPGVSQSTGHGFLHLVMKGKTIGQWSMTDAKSHAMALLLAIEVAPLDTGYLRALMRTGLDRDIAMGTIDSMGAFRLAWTV